MQSQPQESSAAAPLVGDKTAGTVSVIIPARNEEAVIAACVSSLAGQPEIAEIIVVNDQSSDGTANVVRGLMEKIPHLRLIATDGLPDGWLGKNHALWVGVKQAKWQWLLFTDADAEHERDSVSRALQIAHKKDATLVSFSPEQTTETWYEKSLIPFVYLRLAQIYSYEKVTDPKSRVAAANGQFLMMRRDVYDAIGGHSGVAGEVLEDVALAMRTKAAGHGIWFGTGRGIVHVRMYRSFQAMWQGWKKNLYRLMGGTPWVVFREIESNTPWVALLAILVGLKFPSLLFVGIVILILRQTGYGLELNRNQYPLSFIRYYVPAVCLYVGVLWASYRSHVNGSIEWKGRKYSVGAPEPVK